MTQPERMTARIGTTGEVRGGMCMIGVTTRSGKVMSGQTTVRFRRHKQHRVLLEWCERDRMNDCK
jgi:hypothetical protein